MKNKLEIFILTHDEDLIIFESSIFRPLLTGALNKSNKNNFLTDSTGDNISNKNNNYAELTATYWIWKNYLAENPNLEYVGFCHYRRCMDYSKNKNGYPYAKIYAPDFLKKFKSKIYNADYIYEQIKDYDIVLPKKSYFEEGIAEQYKKYHPIEPFDAVNKIIKHDYPEYSEILDNFWKNKNVWGCLNYVMKREIFEEFCVWIFDIMTKLEQECDLSKYKTYNSQKVIAFLAERILNVFILYKIKKDNIKILERDSYFIIQECKYFDFKVIKILNTQDRIIINLLGTKISLRKKAKNV